MSYQELFIKKCIEAARSKDLALLFVPEEQRTPEMCLEAVKSNGNALSYIPYKQRTPEMCLEAVKSDGHALRFVPEEQRTPEMYMEAVKSDGDALRFVPEELRTPEMCLEAVKSDGDALRFVPEELRTPEMYLEIVRSNEYSLYHMPEKLKTSEMYIEAVKRNGGALEYVPEEQITPEICIEAVKSDGDALRFVPEELKTPEMCIEAVKSDREALKYVPEELETSELYLEIIKSKVITLGYVPYKLRTPEMCLEAVKSDGDALRFVPEEQITPEMCLEAVKSDGAVLEYVPEEQITPEMCLEAVKSDGDALEYVPEEQITPEICIEAVKSNVKAIQYVPEELKTPEMCLEAVKSDGIAIYFVPDKLKTPEMCLEAVKSDGIAIDLVPDKLKTPEMCLEAVKSNGDAIQYVPEEQRTPKIYLEAVKNNASTFKYVPLEMRTLDIYIEYLTSNGINDIDDINFDETLEICKKADKFNEVCHFVPSLHVLDKYPEDQIEKFNKKIWFNMARNELYNVNIDTKKSLVEVALSFGAFDKDANQSERIGLIQKMATYIPKDEALVVPALDEFEKENFEVIGREKETTYHINKEKLLSDSNIINLFGSKEQAEVEIEKLAENLSTEDMEKALHIDATDENTNDNYKKVMTYIYKLGYDKAEQDKGYIIKLKTDIQQEKIKDKKRGQELENKIRQFYYTNGSKLIMTPEKLHRIFDGMDMKYKPGFYEFFKDNYEQILADTEKQSELSKIQNQWDKIVEANLGQKVNFEKCEAYIYSHVYENVGEDELEIAKLASNSGYSQEQFEQVQEIFNEQKKRTQSSIPQIEKKDAKTGYTYKVLRLDDPTAIFVGELTDCCQALGNAGESCMRHSVTSPNGRILVVQDGEGKILSQSWIWRNKNTICLDNIEAVQKDSQNKKIVSSDLLSVIQGAAKDFVETDKAGMQKWEKAQLLKLEEEKANGSISEQEYNESKTKIEQVVQSQQLTKVTVGIGYTDVDLSGLKADNENKYPEESVAYISDSRKQLVLYEDQSIQHKDNNARTVAMYRDDEKSTKLIQVDTSEIEQSQDDEYDDEDEIDEYDEIELNAIRNAVRYAGNRQEAREALQNIEKWLDENGIEI